MTPAAADDAEPDGLELFDPPRETREPPQEEAGDRPDPGPASPALRAFAFLLDGLATVAIIVVAVSASLGLSSADAFRAIWVVPIVAAVLDTVLTAVRGFTPGKAVLGLRVVDAGSGAPLGFGRATLRSLVIVAPAVLGALVTVLATRLLPDDLSALVAAVVVPVLGWAGLLVVLAVRPDHRGWQDLAGRSVVLRVR